MNEKPEDDRSLDKLVARYEPPPLDPSRRVAMRSAIDTRIERRSQNRLLPAFGLAAALALGAWALVTIEAPTPRQPIASSASDERPAPSSALDATREPNAAGDLNEPAAHRNVSSVARSAERQAAVAEVETITPETLLYLAAEGSVEMDDAELREIAEDEALFPEDYLALADVLQL